jgi:hypothetical protein
MVAQRSQACKKAQGCYQCRNIILTNLILGLFRVIQEWERPFQNVKLFNETFTPLDVLILTLFYDAITFVWDDLYIQKPM